MRQKSSNNKNGKRIISLSPGARKSRMNSKSFKGVKGQGKIVKLTREDYLYSFPTCTEGSPDVIYMDEIVVYYSFS